MVKIIIAVILMCITCWIVYEGLSSDALQKQIQTYGHEDRP
jgi:hypothetical protein